MWVMTLENQYKDGYKPSIPGLLRDLSEHGKLREFRTNSGKNCNKIVLVRHSDICAKQLLTG